MTYVEFFDKDDVKNIGSCLVHVPDQVVLIGANRSVMLEAADRYARILSEHGYPDVAFFVEVMDASRHPAESRMSAILDRLEQIVVQYPDCVFDLTGGDELCLAAIGMLSERYPAAHIQMHRMSISGGSLIDCDMDGQVVSETDCLSLTAAQQILLYGGAVNERETPAWDMTDPEFLADIERMWDVCRFSRAWNAQIAALGIMEELSQNTDGGLTTSASCAELKQRDSDIFIRGVLDELQSERLLTYSLTDDVITVTYKNEAVKRCLTKAGQVLEMKVYKTALEAKRDTGERIYNDVRNGLCIDWDGAFHDEMSSVCDTENEIDVVMMYGLIPIFVSCKNGHVDVSELYKLQTVAARFGGELVKKILVAPALSEDTSVSALFFKQRAEDMNIAIVKENLYHADVAQWRKIVSSFWK
ncbi:MAG: DUF1887 family protein [Clostridia bacterium]|nr:DUF1887 family protein [Clostridia bacterium]